MTEISMYKLKQKVAALKAELKDTQVELADALEDKKLLKRGNEVLREDVADHREDAARKGEKVGVAMGVLEALAKRHMGFTLFGYTLIISFVPRSLAKRAQAFRRTMPWQNWSEPKDPKEAAF